ncbi:MAG: polynucleotide kinase-phosphatase [Planctomycetota bacterium]
MKIEIPELCMVVLVGPSGSGKSTFARKHFKPTEILTSDFCRGLVSDDENDQAATKDAFEVLHFIAGKRLAARRLVVVDATNVQPEARAPLVALAREHDCLPVAIILDLPEKVCEERNRGRSDRDLGAHVVRLQVRQLRRSIRRLREEGFRYAHVLKTQEEADAVEIERKPLWTDRRTERGPFDVVGDVHGCFEELSALLGLLGYEVRPIEKSPGEPGFSVKPPEGRRAIFLGDLVDRGPDSVSVLRLVMDMVEAGLAFCVPGNHDSRLLKKLSGKDVRITHGLASTLEQMEKESPAFQSHARKFLDGLVSHFALDEGRLVVAHAGMKERYQARASGRVRDFALYGETTGETDEYGLPVRVAWAEDYRGEAAVVYGHTPVPEALWLNKTICIDTGCVFGGRLTAIRWPERELVSVSAAHTYYEPAKPFLDPDAQAPPAAGARAEGDLLDIEDVLGKRIVLTRLNGNVTVREENAIAALEVMARFAADPRWLVYLPPTMSPCETSRSGSFLEHPAEAFDYFLHAGIPRVVCEEKHMGSRAVVVACRDAEAARKRFGVEGDAAGACVTRTGRPFFDDASLEAGLVDRVRAALSKAGAWEALATEWVLLDCELMPWSAKAQALLRQQYAAVGSAARAALPAAVSALERAAARVGDKEPVLPAMLPRFRARADAAERFVEAYRGYCWKVESLEDYRLAPFHLLASEGKVHADRDHLWHMEELTKICRADAEAGGKPVLFETARLVVDVTDEQSRAEGIRWWTERVEKGGEGMVVKPLDFVSKGRRGLVQPAVKCRGPEYLRIIYGPDYAAPENLERLRTRGLFHKRSLALREFALGIEGLERFVRNEPLYRVHECVFAVLALESEPVDPRL